MRFALVVFFVTSLLADEPKLPPDVEPLARLALSAPPEFAADGILKLVEARKIPDKTAAADLLQQAFDLAGSAHFRIGMRSIGGFSPDSREALLGKAYTLKLDAVSLQSRAVLAMLAIDKTKGRQMFTSMSLPDLAPLTCEDSLVYDPAPFYQALVAIVQQGFTAKERAKEDHVAFLIQYAAGLRNLAQLAPTAQTIRSAGLTAAQYDAVVAQFNIALDSLPVDRRSFTSLHDEISSALTPEMVVPFQKTADKYAADLCKPESVNVHAFWQSDDEKRLREGAQKLRTGEGVQMLSDADRRAPEWQVRLAEYEKTISSWQPSPDESDVDFYNEKCLVYEALMELIPSGSERDKALQDFLTFVNASSLQIQNPVQWFAPLQNMLERSRNTNDGQPAKVLAAYEASGSSILALYSAFERSADPATKWFQKSISY